MPRKFEVREILRTLDRASLENESPIWDDRRIIVEGGHIALKDEMKIVTRKYRAPYGLEQVEMRQEGRELDAAGSLYVALMEYKKQDPATPSPLSLGTPGDKRIGPVEDRFRKILERRQAESGEESMDETLSEIGEEMEVGNTPEPKPAEVDFTAQELLQGGATSKLGSVRKLEAGSCLDLTCGGGGHTCDGIQSFQGEDLVTWFGDITEREKSEVQIMAECCTNTTGNIATALGFFSRMCILQSLEMLESEHHLVTALSVESWPGALQTTLKHIRG